MSEAAHITFESLFYYKDENYYYVDNQDIKKMYNDAGGFEKFQIACLSDRRCPCKFRTADSEKLSEIFSAIFKHEITKEQIEQHTGQPRAAKTSSVPVNWQQGKNISPISGQTQNLNLDSNESLTANPQLKKKTSAPVSKTTEEINMQSKNNFTIENLKYYKGKHKDEYVYFVESENFENIFNQKNLYEKFGVRKQRVKKGVCILHTNDVNKISEIFTQIFENTITPDQVVKNEKNQSSQTIFLDKEKYKKLICLLGGAPWMFNKKIHLKLEPSSKA